VIKKSIFVVEDEEDILGLLRFHLTHEGFTVTTAANGEEAVKAIPERPRSRAPGSDVAGIGWT